MSQPALFKRFKNKRTLMMAALMPRQKPLWAAELDAGPDDRPFEEQFRDLAEKLLVFSGQEAMAIEVLRMAGLKPDTELMRAMETPPPLMGLQAVRGWLHRAKQRGLVRTSDLEAATVAIIGSLFLPNLLRHVTGKDPLTLPRPDYLDQVVQLFVHALTVEPD